MDFDQDALVTSVRNAIRSHYEKSEKPLYLSNLGKQVTLPKNMKLKGLLETELASEFALVADPEMPTRIAISPRDKSQTVQKSLSTKTRATHKYPRALLYAFGVAEGRVFYRTSPPNYRVASSPPGEGFIEIPAKLRRELPRFQSLDDLSTQDRFDLERRIELWSNQFNVVLTGTTDASPQGNLLESLLKANQHHLDKLVIPGHVAKALLGRG